MLVHVLDTVGSERVCALYLRVAPGTGSPVSAPLADKTVSRRHTGTCRCPEWAFSSLSWLAVNGDQPLTYEKSPPLASG